MKRVVVYAGTVGMTALMIGVLSLNAELPRAITLVLPILAAAFLGGGGPGLVATLVSITGLALVPAAGATWISGIEIAVVGLGASAAIESLRGAQQRLRLDRRSADETARKLSRIFDSSPVAICLSALDTGKVAEANAAFLALFGVSQDEIIGATPGDAGIVYEIGDRAALLNVVRERGWVRDEKLRVQTRCGRRDIMVSSQAVELGGVRYGLSTFLDITEHARTEAVARELDERFRELADHVSEVFWICDVGERLVMRYTSPSYERMFARSAARLEHDALDWLRAVHPADRPRMNALSATGIQERMTETFRIVHPDGTVRTLRATIFPVRDDRGVVIRVGGITADITDQLALEEQVRQAQKLESLGLLAGGVAHDFNNILAVVGANTGLLGEIVPADEQDLVMEIEKAVTRGSSLTRQLLAFSRRQVVEPVVLDINRVVEDTRKMLRRMVGEDVHLSCSLDPELHAVVMDPGSLVQILMNLAVNARDAMPTGGQLSMTTRNVEDGVLLEVTDSGCGMPRDVVTRIFEPFFTTKDVGKGTGLGLSVVHGIVRQANGRIEVESEPGRGTTFRICFPRSGTDARPQEPAAQSELAGTEKLLVVDDDPFVRTSAARALRSRGYTVLEAGDGNTALQILAENEGSVDLLITDVVMPGMDGRQLAESARATRPSLKVLFTSGYTDDAVLLHGVQQNEVSFLEKPYRNRQLATRVRGIIDAESPRGRLCS